MKVQLRRIFEGEEKATIEYITFTEDIKKATMLLEKNQITLIGKWEGEATMLSHEQILYFESVDEKVFAYTMQKEYRMDQTLSELEELLEAKGFFRCSKAFILNIHQIASLQSEIGSRIDAKLKNGEHLIISRHYVKAFREILREGRL